MQDEQLQRIRARVAKLMALGKDRAASEQEAETALRQAAKLMAKYAINASEIPDGTIDPDAELTTVDVQPDPLYTRTSLAMFHKVLGLASPNSPTRGPKASMVMDSPQCCASVARPATACTRST